MNGSTDENGAAGAIKDNVHQVEDLVPELYEQAPAYKSLLVKGLQPDVAAEFCEIVLAGIFQVEDIDDRTVELVTGMPVEQARFVLTQFRKSNLMGVLHPVPFLTSLLRNFKDRVRLSSFAIASTQPIYYAPKADSLQALLDRTNYPIEVTSGQRKYGPPPAYDGPAPGAGCEIYIGRIPREMYEDDLVPLLEKYGTIYDFRLMMDPISGQGKGYGFALFMDKAQAAAAAKALEDYEVKPGKKLRCNVSIANTRLFVGNIPKSKSREEIMNELSVVAELEGVQQVIIYPDPSDPQLKKNSGYCFVEFTDHKSASTAKRRLGDGAGKLFDLAIMVNWAEPQEDVDEDTMSKVKTLFVKNLRPHVDEEAVKKLFSHYGHVFKVRRTKDYAFVFFDERDQALLALEKMNAQEYMGAKLDISLARPQSEARKKLVQTRYRMQHASGNDPYYQQYSPYPGYGYGAMPGGGMAPPPQHRAPFRGGMRPPMMMGGPAMRARASPSMAAQFRMGRGAAGTTGYGGPPTAPRPPAYPGYPPMPGVPPRPRMDGFGGAVKRPMNGAGFYPGQGVPAAKRRTPGYTSFY